MPRPRKGGFERMVRRKRQEVAHTPVGIQVGSFGPSAIDLAINEFGVPGKVAERPAFRQALQAALDPMRHRIARDLRNGGINERSALEIGNILASELRHAIEQFAEPPNRPWKPKSDPLVFGGKMLDSIGVRIIR